MILLSDSKFPLIFVLKVYSFLSGIKSDYSSFITTTVIRERIQNREDNGFDPVYYYFG